VSAIASPPGLRRIGHKGAAALVEGNTVASFERAVEIGVDMVELDVLRLRDDPATPDPVPLVVAHDPEDAAGRSRLTLADALDAFTRPPLDAVEIDCDLKLPGREEELVEALRDRDLLDRAMVSTMYVESLARIAALEPRLRRGWTYPLVTRPWDRSTIARPAVATALALLARRFPGQARRRAPAMGVAAIWVFHRLVTARLAAVTAGLGIELIAWTVDDAATIARLRTLGVDGIVSNDPRLLQEPAGQVSGA
jgi:glycerophosphoryl diester phosphodiesterase